MKVVWNTGDGAKWYNNKTITSATVASGVVDMSSGLEWNAGCAIGVFQDCPRLHSVKLPESLRKIGGFAFCYCDALVCVDIPSGVNEIGMDAFAGCESLQTVTIPEGIVDLHDETFNKCSSLRFVELPTSLKSIGYQVFGYCSSLATINFDAIKGVTKIGKQAFIGCSALTTFKLPPFLKVIKRGTFRYCENLSSVELPAYIDTIRESAFSNCSEDLSIVLPLSVGNTSVRNHLLNCMRSGEEVFDIGKLRNAPWALHFDIEELRKENSKLTSLVNSFRSENAWLREELQLKLPSSSKTGVIAVDSGASLTSSSMAVLATTSTARHIGTVTKDELDEKEDEETVNEDELEETHEIATRRRVSRRDSERESNDACVIEDLEECKSRVRNLMIENASLQSEISRLQSDNNEANSRIRIFEAEIESQKSFNVSEAASKGDSDRGTKRKTC